jgi:hypothetical protein
MKPIHFHGRITESIYVRAQKMALRDRPGLWKWVLLLAAVLVLRIFTDDHSYISTPSDVIATTLAVVLLIGVVWAFFAYSTRRQYRNLAEIYQDMDVTVDDDGFHYLSRAGTMNYTWNELKRAVFRRDFGLVYRTPIFFLIFDRQFFASEEKWSALVSAIDERVTMKRRGRFLASPR